MKNVFHLFVVVICFVFFGVKGFAIDKPKKDEISMERAQEIAMRAVSGTIKSSEYEHEKGQNVYSFDIDGTDGKIHEVLVSARSGKIVSATIESMAKEAAEKKADEMSDEKAKKK